jgi:DNA polymerase-3 subunit alpha
MADFVHLHVHSDYSLLKSTASIPELVAKALSLGMKHLALTDSGTMSGIPEFVKACRNAAIHPVIGSEFSMDSGCHLVLLACNDEGYRNLTRLSSYAHTNAMNGEPRIDDGLLILYHRGLIGLSGCLDGEIPARIRNSAIKAAEERALWFRLIFGTDNFFLELQDHQAEVQKEINTLLVDISGRTGIPLVVTNDVRYLEKEDAPVQDILLCIGQMKTREQQDRIRLVSGEFYFKNKNEMTALFSAYPEALANTVRIAERCDVTISGRKPELPEFDIPPGFDSPAAYLRHLAMTGLEKRYPGCVDSVRERAEYELEIIGRMGFVGYFLIIADLTTWAREQSILMSSGRGAVPSSVVAYALGITNMDPVHHNLLFERFINPDRPSMPDIDLDFSPKGRKLAVDYLEVPNLMKYWQR